MDTDGGSDPAAIDGGDLAAIDAKVQVPVGDRLEPSYTAMAAHMHVTLPTVEPSYTAWATYTCTLHCQHWSQSIL